MRRSDRVRTPSPAKPAPKRPAPEKALSTTDSDDAEDRKAATPKVIHEVIRAEGEAELDRAWPALLFSGLAGGISVSASVLAQGALGVGLPKDAAWTPLVAGIGYSVGFVIAIMGRLQLFTETTVTAVLPVASTPTWHNFGRLMRLWGIVFAANMVGTLIVAALIAYELIVTPELRTAILELSRHALSHDPGTTILLGIPAGFLIASIAWMLPNARGSEFWIILFVTWVVSIGGFSHVVAGSTEAFTLWLAGERGFWPAFGGFILPALLGNIIGGTGLFAVLAHAQVRSDDD